MKLPTKVQIYGTVESMNVHEILAPTPFGIPHCRSHLSREKVVSAGNHFI